MLLENGKIEGDEEKIEAWTMANNQVITWILQNVSERIKMVIIYTLTAKGIWYVLEKIYTVANSARKFKLNKESYEITQNIRSIEEYYTQLQIIWDELEHMCTLPTITKIITEIAEYLKAVDTLGEEIKSFQFLKGLDKEYGILRNNILLMDPLPSVEHTVPLMLQEEMQTSNVGGARQQKNFALMSTGAREREKCTHCGRDNHRSGLCWEIKGYPIGHPKHKKFSYKSWSKAATRWGYKQQRAYPFNARQSNYRRYAANVKADQ
ncbi:hypothetical protein RND81_03G119000 [Saponaria officinalis]|uniref:Retrotransposon gag domain-containing protein n=1 Tax=Saponaria officinalis TaxID=3572 RepID=A0AAW1M6Z5_SAPOF